MPAFVQPERSAPVRGSSMSAEVDVERRERRAPRSCKPSDRAPRERPPSARNRPNDRTSTEAPMSGATDHPPARSVRAPSRCNCRSTARCISACDPATTLVEVLRDGSGSRARRWAATAARARPARCGSTARSRELHDARARRTRAAHHDHRRADPRRRSCIRSSRRSSSTTPCSAASARPAW